ncbi:hypothetical protein AAVH_39565 [Aphelenchoides avenae]|nr:hypothetical protein AAVH_39565 [Aphelenchus avenae]
MKLLASCLFVLLVVGVVIDTTQALNCRQIHYGLTCPSLGTWATCTQYCKWLAYTGGTCLTLSVACSPKGVGAKVCYCL